LNGDEQMQKLTLYFLRTVGVALILVGIVAAYYGPLEIFVFYLFSEGGRFYYDGFGMGSFWFAALVVQNIGYYVIAALFIPVGIGHVKLRRWALSLTQLYIWFWLGAGILLFGDFILLIPSVLRLDLNQDVLLFQLVTVGVSSLFFLVLLPILALWLYKRETVKSAFEEHDSNKYWTERYPFPLLALLLLYVIMIVAMHTAIFFQGLFPMFGQILLGRPAAYIIALCILILGILIYGTVQLKKWAWWSSLVYVSLLTVSSVMSFSGHRFYDIIVMMNLPAYEMELIDKMVVLHDYPLVGLFAAPLLITLGLVIYSRRYFGKNNNLGKPNAS
jgi:MFS family permease